MSVGVVYAMAGFICWGLSPLYFKSIADAPAVEVLAHRAVWSLALLLAILAWRGRVREVWAALRDRARLAPLLLSTCLIALNWWLYLYAVVSGHILQASLGYYINPLMNVAIGLVVLKERMTRTMGASFALAGAGVVWLAMNEAEGFPWLALCLASSFAVYTLVRKRARVDALVGLTVETALLAPLAAGYLVFVALRGEMAWLAPAARGGSARLDVLLPLACVVTALPLLWFTEGARRLPLRTISILQYTSPTLQFMMAMVYGEKFTTAHGVAFACIWTALAMYTASAVRERRRAGT